MAKKIRIKDAEEVSTNMAFDTFSKKISELTNQVNAKADELADKNTPDLVKKAYEKHQSYFNTSRLLYVKSGVGSVIELNCDKLHVSKGGWSISIEVDVAEYEAIKKQKDEIKKLDELRVVTAQKIKATLLSLSRYDRIISEFPEAEKYLPTDDAKSVTTVTTPIKDLRELINQYSK